jgi:putative oxidoreductase
MFGGLLIAAGDTAGNPSAGWRGRHAVKSVRHDVALATKSAKAPAKTAAKPGARIGLEVVRRCGGRRGRGAG